MSYNKIDRRILDVATRQYGAAASRQLVESRLDQRQLTRRVDAGMLRRVRGGLLVHTSFPPSWEQDEWLALLAAGNGAVVGGRAAARIHGVRRYEDAPNEVLVHEGHSHATTVGVVHRTFWLPPDHIVEIGGFSVTSIARTVLDLAGLPRHPMAFRNEQLREIHVKRTKWLANEAMRYHDLRMIDLMRVAAAVRRRGKPGTSIIREVVDDLGADYVPSASEIEDVFLDLARAAGIEEPEREVNLGTKDKWVGRVDFCWRGRRVVVEIDGRQHTAPLDRRADRLRDTALVSEGWSILRFTWWDLIHDPERVIREVREALASAAA